MSEERLFLALLMASPFALAAAAMLFFRARRGRRAGVGAVLVGNGLLAALLLSVAFVALESWYRWGYDTTDVWNRSRVSKRWFERYWATNSDGLRDDVDYAYGRTPGVPRITFVGDSYTAAHGVKDVGDRFVNRIRAERPQWEVHALASNGLNTLEEIDLVRRMSDAGYELDVVVLVYCHNDIDTYVREFQTLYRSVDVAPESLGFVLRTSYAADFYYQRWRLAQRALGADVDYAGLRRAAYGGRAWTFERESLRDLAALSRARGARFAVVTFPWMQLLLAGVPNDAMHAVLDAFWAEEGIPELDLLPLLRDLPARELVVNTRDTHPNERAHALAADAVIRFLEERVLTLPPSGVVGP